MTHEELKKHLRQMADTRCKQKHRDYYESLICVGPASRDFGPPCDECRAEIVIEYNVKRGKMHGRELSPEEAAALRKRLGIK